MAELTEKSALEAEESKKYKLLAQKFKKAATELKKQNEDLSHSLSAATDKTQDEEALRLKIEEIAKVILYFPRLL